MNSGFQVNCEHPDGMTLNGERKMLITASVILLALNVSANLLPDFVRGCEEHWIKSVSNNGGLIKLDDGSLWRVRRSDVPTSAVWLPFAETAVCGDRLINEDTRESVHVERLR